MAKTTQSRSLSKAQNSRRVSPRLAGHTPGPGLQPPARLTRSGATFAGTASPCPSRSTRGGSATSSPAAPSGVNKRRRSKKHVASDKVRAKASGSRGDTLLNPINLTQTAIPSGGRLRPRRAPRKVTPIKEDADRDSESPSQIEGSATGKASSSRAGAVASKVSAAASTSDAPVVAPSTRAPATPSYRKAPALFSSDRSVFAPSSRTDPLTPMSAAKSLAAASSSKAKGKTAIRNFSGSENSVNEDFLRDEPIQSVEDYRNLPRSLQKYVAKASVDKTTMPTRKKRIPSIRQPALVQKADMEEDTGNQGRARPGRELNGAHISHHQNEVDQPPSDGGEDRHSNQPRLGRHTDAIRLSPPGARVQIQQADDDREVDSEPAQPTPDDQTGASRLSQHPSQPAQTPRVLEEQVSFVEQSIPSRSSSSQPGRSPPETTPTVFQRLKTAFGVHKAISALGLASDEAGPSQNHPNVRNGHQASPTQGQHQDPGPRRHSHSPNSPPFVRLHSSAENLPQTSGSPKRRARSPAGERTAKAAKSVHVQNVDLRDEAENADGRVRSNLRGYHDRDVEIERLRRHIAELELERAHATVRPAPQLIVAPSDGASLQKDKDIEGLKRECMMHASFNAGLQAQNQSLQSQNASMNAQIPLVRAEHATELARQQSYFSAQLATAEATHREHATLAVREREVLIKGKDELVKRMQEMQRDMAKESLALTKKMYANDLERFRAKLKNEKETAKAADQSEGFRCQGNDDEDENEAFGDSKSIDSGDVGVFKEEPAESPDPCAAQPLSPSCHGMSEREQRQGADKPHSRSPPPAVSNYGQTPKRQSQGLTSSSVGDAQSFFPIRHEALTQSKHESATTPNPLQDQPSIQVRQLASTQPSLLRTEQLPMRLKPGPGPPQSFHPSFTQEDNGKSISSGPSQSAQLQFGTSTKPLRDLKARKSAENLLERSADILGQPGLECRPALLIPSPKRGRVKSIDVSVSQPDSPLPQRSFHSNVGAECTLEEAPPGGVTAIEAPASPPRQSPGAEREPLVLDTSITKLSTPKEPTGTPEHRPSRMARTDQKTEISVPAVDVKPASEYEDVQQNPAAVTGTKDRIKHVEIPVPASFGDQAQNVKHELEMPTAAVGQSRLRSHSLDIPAHDRAQQDKERIEMLLKQRTAASAFDEHEDPNDTSTTLPWSPTDSSIDSSAAPAEAQAQPSSYTLLSLHDLPSTVVNPASRYGDQGDMASGADEDEKESQAPVGTPKTAVESGKGKEKTDVEERSSERVAVSSVERKKSSKVGLLLDVFEPFQSPVPSSSVVESKAAKGVASFPSTFVASPSVERIESSPPPATVTDRHSGRVGSSSRFHITSSAMEERDEKASASASQTSSSRIARPTSIQSPVLPKPILAPVTKPGHSSTPLQDDTVAKAVPDASFGASGERAIGEPTQVPRDSRTTEWVKNNMPSAPVSENAEFARLEEVEESSIPSESAPLEEVEQSSIPSESAPLEEVEQSSIPSESTRLDEVEQPSLSPESAEDSQDPVDVCVPESSVASAGAIPLPTSISPASGNEGEARAGAHASTPTVPAASSRALQRIDTSPSMRTSAPVNPVQVSSFLPLQSPKEESREAMQAPEAADTSAVNPAVQIESSLAALSVADDDDSLYTGPSQSAPDVKGV